MGIRCKRNNITTSQSKKKCLAILRQERKNTSRRMLMNHQASFQYLSSCSQPKKKCLTILRQERNDTSRRMLMNHTKLLVSHLVLNQKTLHYHLVESAVIILVNFVVEDNRLRQGYKHTDEISESLPLMRKETKVTIFPT